MAKSKSTKTTTAPQDAPRAGVAEYTVVARRYRPQQFADLIGQEHVAAALVNALQSGRVAHAYLFTGARGVGKTSAARILAKALNCEKGPTATPCDQCESCKAIALGEDVDVVEIDGASNNRVDEARDLRQNVGFRPTRGQYKIYIIDEVHMLSTGAFNALLKTLEEPPPHVKFILATTEVQKIPITILSRCQRFDFAHVGPAKIFEQLRKIVDREGYQADDEALKLIARRAGGSMRDSQSLLDQLIASSSGTLTAEQVNAVLGTAGDERVTQLATAVLDRDAKTALDLIAGWVERGLQIGELIDQMVGYWRTLMLINCGGSEVRELPVTPSQKEAALRHAQQVSLDEILAGLDVWTAVKGRMRDNALAQVLLEMAVVRLARMDELLGVGKLASALAQGRVPMQAPGTSRPPSTANEAGESAKKNGRVTPGPAPAPDNIRQHPAGVSLSELGLPSLWNRVNRHLSDKSPMLASHLKFASLPAISGPNTLVICFQSAYNQAYEVCDREENIRRIEETLERECGQGIKVVCELVTGPASASPQDSNGPPQSAQTGDRKKQLMGLPLFRKAGEVLGAQIWHVDDDFNPIAPARPAAAPDPETDPDEI